jgi:hypothetical protein
MIDLFRANNVVPAENVRLPLPVAILSAENYWLFFVILILRVLFLKDW